MPDGAVWTPASADVFFSDQFSVSPAALEAYGAFHISVVSDLPVIDPFLRTGHGGRGRRPSGLAATHSALLYEFSRTPLN